MLESSIPLQRGQNLISEEQMMNMGNELVRLCSSIERHGLVDYEYGVWEERIIDSKSLEVSPVSQLDTCIFTGPTSTR